MDARLSCNPAEWKQLYVGALFEGNPAKLAGRIGEARAAIVVRARDLLRTPGDHIEESQALDDALYALDALTHCYLPEQDDGVAA